MMFLCIKTDVMRMTDPTWDMFMPTHRLPDPTWALASPTTSRWMNLVQNEAQLSF